MSDALLLAPYAIGLGLVWATFTARKRRKESRVKVAEQEALDAGLTEPASLHPVIDPSACIGCGACVTACPEGKILGLVEGKASLIEPTRCIGHGACAAACPMGAIDLVFGTEKRGIDIPQVGPDFQTNVRGIFIAGELGGMGLIRNAIEQGRQAMEQIVKAVQPGSDHANDVVRRGAGPAGIAASLAAKAAGLRYRVLEQDSLGGTVSHFPRGKLVMTAPAHLPIVGKMNFREVSKEKLMSFWESVVAEQELAIQYETRVDAVKPKQGGFSVNLGETEIDTQKVLLTIGRRGTPRKLGVAGEDQPKVVYRLIDPEQYKGKKVTVVGGGDSAIEAACSLAEQPDTIVTISYRSEAFSRAKSKNRERIGEMSQAGRLEVLLSSNVTMISENEIEFGSYAGSIVRENDAVIVCAGGILPTGFIKSMGIEVETKHGTK